MIGAKKLQAKSAVENSTCQKWTDQSATNGGKVKVDLDMQKHHMRNLPLPQETGE